MKLAIACDHGGYELKNTIIEYLKSRDITADDLGTYSDESVDYPDFSKKLAESILDGKYDRGIIVCGTGIGVSIGCNRYKGIRCALCTSVEMASLARRHNNANIVALGGRTTEPEDAVKIVETWLDTEFEGGRHKRRTDKLDELG